MCTRRYENILTFLLEYFLIFQKLSIQLTMIFSLLYYSNTV